MSFAAYQPPSFREIEAVELWSAKLKLEVPFEEFADTVGEVSHVIEQGYSGFITQNSDGDVTSFTGTRYPRKKYGVLSIEECEAGMDALASEFSTSVELDTRRSGMRVVMGLLEGYDADSPRHSVCEVKGTLIEANVSPVNIFAVRHTPEGTSTYTEPAVVLEAPLNSKADVYLLGDDLRQERFTIEDFENQGAYIVETRFCSQPD